MKVNDTWQSPHLHDTYIKNFKGISDLMSRWKSWFDLYSVALKCNPPSDLHAFIHIYPLPLVVIISHSSCCVIISGRTRKKMIRNVREKVNCGWSWEQAYYNVSVDIVLNCNNLVLGSRLFVTGCLALRPPPSWPASCALRRTSEPHAQHVVGSGCLARFWLLITGDFHLATGY